MNILLATPFMSQHFDSGLFWVKAICQLGHAVVLWDYRVSPQIPPGRWDLSLVMKGESIDPRELPHEIDRATGRVLHPRVCYWPDDLERTPGIEKTLQHYDKVYTPVRPTPPGMEWLPTGWDPDIHRYTGAPRDIPSLYIGTNNSDRKVEFLKNLWPHVIAGNGWAQWAERVKVSDKWEPTVTWVETSRFLPPHYLHDFVALASRAQVAINIHQGPVGQNRKLFELIPSAFTITDRVPGVEEVLGDIAEAVSFTTPEEGKAMLERWLAEPAGIREEMWQYERERIAPFTYQNAIRKILGS